MSYKTLHRRLKRQRNMNPNKIQGELMCSGRVGCSCST